MKNPTEALSVGPECAVDASALYPHCDYPLRVARRKLRDMALAEDAVHDVRGRAVGQGLFRAAAHCVLGSRRAGCTV